MLARLKAVVFGLGVLAFLGLPSPVMAGPIIEISNVPDTVPGDGAFEFDVSFTGDKQYYANATYYFRAVFFPLGTTNYFGFIENNAGEWGNDYRNKATLYQFTTNAEGSFSGKLRAKADLGDPAFSDANEYGFKIGRYTEKGTSASPWSNSATVFIDYTEPATPVPTPSPTPTQAPTPTPTPKPATPTPKPATPKPKASPSGLVLGEASAAGELDKPVYDLTASASASKEAEVKKPLAPKLIPLILLMGGIITAGAAIPLGMKFLVNPEE